MAKRQRTLEERFWSKVDKSGDCWVWTGTRMIRNGYGRIKAGDGTRLRRSAHRVSYELANGPIPDGLCVCHRCDNPPCVNPAHLFLGTLQDNMADMVAKKRTRKDGAMNPQAKLSADQVREIRSRLSAGVTRKALTSEFGVCYGTIMNIDRGHSWTR